MPPFPELPFPRRMWAGGEVRWQAPIAPGDRLHRHSTIARADLKHGSSSDFLLASVAHSIVAPDGPRIEERQDIVFLPETSRPGSAPPQPVPFVPAWDESRSFGPVDLFRYSALTLNSHRIHYDSSYARDAEHYRGIVVHGPLLGSTLIHVGEQWGNGRVPAGIRYRAVAPSLAGEVLKVLGALTGDGAMSLAIAGEDGDLRMMATMNFGEAP